MINKPADAITVDLSHGGEVSAWRSGNDLVLAVVGDLVPEGLLFFLTEPEAEEVESAIRAARAKLRAERARLHVA